MLPIAAEIATRLTREQAQSARPHAPVIPVEDSSRRASSLARRFGAWRRKGHSPSQSTTNPRHAW